MRDWIYHVVIGNDAPPWMTATARGLLGAVVIGGLAFFNIWAQTDDLKLLISGTAVPVLTWVGMRAGIEGMMDTSKNKRSGN